MHLLMAYDISQRFHGYIVLWSKRTHLYDFYQGDHITSYCVTSNNWTVFCWFPNGLRIFKIDTIRLNGSITWLQNWHLCAHYLLWQPMFCKLLVRHCKWHNLGIMYLSKLPREKFNARVYISTTTTKMKTSSNENIFRVTGPLCWEFTGHRWIPLTKAWDAELWCFLWSASWINGWVNNRQAGDLRRYRGHCDVIAMQIGPIFLWEEIMSCRLRRTSA